MAQNFRAMSAEELLHELEMAGRAPDLELIRACMDRRHDLTTGLLDMLAAPPDERWEGGDPHWYAAIHAGHLLIYFREPRALAIFFQLFRDPENENLLDWFTNGVASYGMAALPDARALLNDETIPEHTRFSMPDLLQEIAAEFPTERAQVADILRAALPALDAEGKILIPKPRPEKPNMFWAFIALALTKMHDFRSRPQIEKLFRDGWLDESVMGDVHDYLKLLMNDTPLTAQPFNIIATYERLQRDAQQEQEWEAKRLEVLAQQEKIKTRATAETTAHDATAEDASNKTSDAQSALTEQTIRRDAPKVGRNDPCPCGSGRKYKHCHGKS